MAEKALPIILATLNVTDQDEIAPVIGEPSLDPTTGEWHVRFTRPGESGYYLCRFKVEHMPAFKPQGSVP